MPPPPRGGRGKRPALGKGGGAAMQGGGCSALQGEGISVLLDGKSHGGGALPSLAVGGGGVVLHGGKALEKVAANGVCGGATPSSLSRTRSGKVLNGSLVLNETSSSREVSQSSSSSSSKEVSQTSSSTSSLPQALVEPCGDEAPCGGSNGYNGVVSNEISANEDSSDEASSSESETSSEEESSSSEDEQGIVDGKIQEDGGDVMMANENTHVPNSLEEIALDYVSQQEDVSLLEKSHFGNGNLPSSSSMAHDVGLSPTLRTIFGIQDKHLNVQSSSPFSNSQFKEGTNLQTSNSGSVFQSLQGGKIQISCEKINGSQCKNTSNSVESARHIGRCKNSGLGGVLEAVSGEPQFPASLLPAKMVAGVGEVVGRAKGHAEVAGVDGGAVQSAATISNLPFNEPNKDKICDFPPTNGPPAHSSSLPSHQSRNSNMGAGTSNLAAENVSLLGAPPISLHNKKPTNQFAWAKQPKVDFLPKVPCLAEISKDGNCVLMDEESTIEHVEKLNCALVGKTLGKALPFLLLKSELKRIWGMYGDFSLSILSSNTFICFFSSREIRDSIVLGGPWLAANQVLALDCWSEGFEPNKLGGFSSPTWIRLPQLPLHYWTKINLARIGSMLGDPLFVDETTMNWNRTEFARICVRLDFAKRIPSGVWIEGKTRKFFQPIVYEGLPKICFNCGFVGHDEVECKRPKPTPLASPSSAPPFDNSIQPLSNNPLPLPNPSSPHHPMTSTRLHATPTLDPHLPTIPPPTSQPPNPTTLLAAQTQHPKPSTFDPSLDLHGSATILEDDWIVKRNRKVGAQRKNHFIPWKRYRKPNNKLYNWRKVKDREPKNLNSEGNILIVSKDPLDLFGNTPTNETGLHSGDVAIAADHVVCESVKNLESSKQLAISLQPPKSCIMAELANEELGGGDTLKAVECVVAEQDNVRKGCEIVANLEQSNQLAVLNQPPLACVLAESLNAELGGNENLNAMTTDQNNAEMNTLACECGPHDVALSEKLDSPSNLAASSRNAKKRKKNKKHGKAAETVHDGGDASPLVES